MVHCEVYSEKRWRKKGQITKQHVGLKGALLVKFGLDKDFEIMCKEWARAKFTKLNNTRKFALQKDMAVIDRQLNFWAKDNTLKVCTQFDPNKSFFMTKCM